MAESHLLNEIDIQWMKLALVEAQKAAAMGEVPVGSIAVFNNQVIGWGFNAKEIDQDPTAHAEMLAVKQAAQFLENWRLIDVTLYSTLEPCPMCAGAMVQARLQRLVYGAPDVRFGAAGSVVDILSKPYFNHSIEVTAGILEDEAAELLQEFFRSIRKREQ